MANQMYEITYFKAVWESKLKIIEFVHTLPKRSLY